MSARNRTSVWGWMSTLVRAWPHLGVARVPMLSVANVRELLKASLPLPQITSEQERRLVVTHLVGRSRATASRRRERHLPTKDSP